MMTALGRKRQRRGVGEEGDVLKEPLEEEEMQVSKMSKEEADFKPSTPFCRSFSEPPQVLFALASFRHPSAQHSFLHKQSQ